MISQMIGINGALDGMVFSVDMAGTGIASKTARVQRVATLDGGAVINHSGYSVGDQTYTVRAVLSAAQVEQLEEIITGSAEIGLSAPEGYFIGAVDFWKNEAGKLTMNFLISEQEA